MFTATRTDTTLALALAGTAPDQMGAAGVVARADYLRLLALGATPGLAAQILFDGAGTAGHRRQDNAAFTRVCEAEAIRARLRELAGAVVDHPHWQSIEKEKLVAARMLLKKQIVPSPTPARAAISLIGASTPEETNTAAASSSNVCWLRSASARRHRTGTPLSSLAVGSTSPFDSGWLNGNTVPHNKRNNVPI